MICERVGFRRFRRQRRGDGSLDFHSCGSTEAVLGPCAALPAGTLRANIGKLPVSTDGESVYIKQQGSPSSLTRLTGSLAFAGCLGIGVAACAAPPLPGPFAVGTGAAALSPDGRQLYQSAGDQLNTFSLAGTDASPPAPAAPETPAAPAAPAVPATPAVAKPVIKSIREVREGRYRGRYKVKIRVFHGGAISARFEGRLKRGAKLRALSKTIKRSATRSATYTLYLKPSAIARRRKLRAKLVVTLAPLGYTAAQASKTIRLH